MRTLILGIGSPILGDDGIGIHVARELAREIKDKDIDVEDTGAAGLNLLELVVGYDEVIIIDAIMTDDGEVGEIYRFGPENFVKTVHPTTSPHNANLATVIEIGKKSLSGQMPAKIVVFAVNIQEVTRFTEEMTSEVREAIPTAVNLVLEEIDPNKG
ncbi:hydrogenase maturation protease [Chloroflexota bacterium]